MAVRNPTLKKVTSSTSEADETRQILIRRVLMVVLVLLLIGSFRFLPSFLAHQFPANKTVEVSQTQWTVLVPIVAAAAVGFSDRPPTYAALFIVRSDLVRGAKRAALGTAVETTSGMPTLEDLEILEALRNKVAGTSECMNGLHTASIGERRGGMQDSGEIFQTALNSVGQESRCAPLTGYFTGFAQDKLVAEMIPVHVVTFRKLGDLFANAPSSKLDLAFDRLDAQPESVDRDIIRVGLLAALPLGQMVTKLRAEQLEQRVAYFERWTLLANIIIFWILLAPPVFGRTADAETVFLKLAHLLESVFRTS
jgi:hypothetical protein